MVYRPTRNLPITQETTFKNAKKWLSFVRFGESGAVIQLQDDCEYRVTEIIENPKILKQFLGPYYRKYLLKYVSFDGIDLEKSIKEALLEIIKQRRLAFDLRKNLNVNELLELIAKKGYEVGLFIGRITPLIDEPKFLSLLNLELILQKSKNLSVILFCERNITYPNYRYLTDKCSLIFDNLDFYSLYSEADSRQFMIYQSGLWKMKINPKLTEKIISLSCGYLWLMAALLRFYRDNSDKKIDEIFQDESFIRKLEVVWNKFTVKEKLIIQSVLNNNLVQEQKQSVEFVFLGKIGLIKSRKQEVGLRLPLLKIMIDYEKKLNKLKIQEKKIWFNSKDMTASFSKNEKIFLELLLKKPQKILSREELAQNLWGKVWEEKYSDWALDRLAYRLRQRLDLLGVDGGLLITKKRKGFCWG